MFDSTHGTNNIKWYLSNLMVRDEHLTWIPAAYMLLQSENTNLVSTGLTCLKILVREWKPRYFITDECRVEKAGIREAFGGLRVGEQEVGRYLSRSVRYILIVHSKGS